MFQVLWKSYIDFEIEQEEFGNTRNLYKRLLQRTQHVKVRTCRTQFDPVCGATSGRFIISLMTRLSIIIVVSFFSAGLDQLRQVRAVHRQPRAAAEVPADLRGGQQGHEELRGEGGAADAAGVLEGL